MTIKTITQLDTLKIASGEQSVLEMIEKITTNGNLNAEYEYLYTDLFVIFNRIYNNGKALDSTISNNQKNDINNDFNNMSYHVKVAIGLAAGVVTAPGVPFEMDHAKHWSEKAQSGMKILNGNPSSIIANSETRNYVEGLQKATADKALNVNELVKNLFWTIIVNLNNINATKDDFEASLAEIHLHLVKLRDGKWKGVFDLKGLKINLDKPGEGDDFETVQKVLGIVGDVVGVLGLVIMVYNWKANGLKPGRFLKSAFQRLTSSSSEEAAEATATDALVEEEVIEVSTLEIFGDVLGVLGLILAVIGGIVEAIELGQELGKIDKAKKSFNKNYNKLVTNIDRVIQASEGIRRHN